MMGPGDITEHASAICWGGGGACRWRRQGAHHVFLIKEYCLNVSAGRDGGCSHSGITRVPGSERKREGSRMVQEV